MTDHSANVGEFAAPTPETPPGAPGTMDPEFMRRLVAYASAWHRETIHVLPFNAPEQAAALWAYVQRREAGARAETLTECIAVAEDEAKHQKSLTAHAESKGQGVMHFCAGEGADRVVARLAALPVPAAAPEAESRPTSRGDGTMEVPMADRPVRVRCPECGARGPLVVRGNLLPDYTECRGVTCDGSGTLLATLADPLNEAKIAYTDARLTWLRGIDYTSDDISEAEEARDQAADAAWRIVWDLTTEAPMPADLPPLPRGWSAHRVPEMYRWDAVNENGCRLSMTDNKVVTGFVHYSARVSYAEVLVVLSHLEARAEQGGPDE